MRLAPLQILTILNKSGQATSSSFHRHPLYDHRSHGVGSVLSNGTPRLARPRLIHCVGTAGGIKTRLSAAASRLQWSRYLAL